METLQELKQGLLGKIAEIEDYDVLLALKEEVTLYQNQATAEERDELIKDKGEISIDADGYTHEDFKKAMSRWLTS